VPDDRRREPRPRPNGADERQRRGRANRQTAPAGEPTRGGRQPKPVTRGSQSERARGGVRAQHPHGGAREAPRPGLARKADEPAVPSDVDTRALHRSVRAELRGLPKELGDIVAAHLVVAGQLIDDDPELAYAHAEAARRRAARLPIVREAAAETAYAAGRYDVALSEFRALRRMTGVDDYLPVMADCERALGRPDAALKLAKQARGLTLDPALMAEMIIVEAGARSDLGQPAEALRILRAGISDSGRSGFPRQAAARLRFAYADLLARNGSEDLAREWFGAAAKLDHEQETDAQARLDELDGLVLDLDETGLDVDDGQSGTDEPPGAAGQSTPIEPTPDPARP
jgi:tetratricopeptide (TPR) repeat protein